MDKHMTIQDRPPNWRNADGGLYLVRCYECDSLNGLENRLTDVARGVCAWCGWKEDGNG